MRNLSKLRNQWFESYLVTNIFSAAVLTTVLPRFLLASRSAQNVIVDLQKNKVRSLSVICALYWYRLKWFLWYCRQEYSVQEDQHAW